MSRFALIHPASRCLPPGGVAVGSLLLAVSITACGAAAPTLPTPRPLVVYSGVRVTTDKERMQEVDRWFRQEMENIDVDPSFMIETVASDGEGYVWEGLLIVADTARIRTPRAAPEAQYPHMIYAHLHLMDRMGRQDEWLPEGGALDGYDLERAILARVADSWLYGRAVFAATPYAPLDELVYAAEHGFLDAMILTARQDEFPDEVREWLNEDPQGMETYRRWFVETFAKEPPGLGEGRGLS